MRKPFEDTSSDLNIKTFIDEYRDEFKAERVNGLWVLYVYNKDKAGWLYCMTSRKRSKNATCEEIYNKCNW